MSEFYKNIHKKPSLIAGPCVWEGYSHAEAIAEKLLAVCGKHDVISFIKRVLIRQTEAV